MLGHRSTFVALLLLATAGCPGQVPPGGGHTQADGSADLLADSSPMPPDVGPADLSADGQAQDTGLDQLALDQRTPDLLAPDSAPLVDSGPDTTPSCSASTDKETVALYTFEATKPGSKIENVAGKGRDATIQAGSLTPISNGPMGCGKAGQFAGQTYLEVDHEKAFELTEGAVDLWVRFDQSGSAGLVSKDATGQQVSGHLTIFRACNDAIAVRQQTKTESIVHCSKPVPNSSWMHVAINFGAGGLELYLDGARVQEVGQLTCGGKITCSTTALAAGIAPNKNPWVIGASAIGSGDDVATPVSAQLVGAIDSLRISKTRRTFAP
jgi:hypothetical protein